MSERLENAVIQVYAAFVARGMTERHIQEIFPSIVAQAQFVLGELDKLENTKNTIAIPAASKPSLPIEEPVLPKEEAALEKVGLGPALITNAELERVKPKKKGAKW